ncbi:MAG: 5'-methylthioadenosine/S-adenosylhomocysteine nucleosidase [candidate division Zixibacteria bacterium]|nr:5'-methylthioadenosine/S-adenosylhomocysteine nucleosidase [candidate division Zixibacteria bacterium]
MSRLHSIAFCLIFSVTFGRAIAAERPVLLLYAFDEEGGTVAKSMSVADRDTVLGREVLIGTASGQKIILAETGVGMTNAAMTTQALIDRYSPRSVLLTGIAGGIDSSIKVGDIVAPEIWIQHDYGYVGADDFQPDSLCLFDPKIGKEVILMELLADDSMLARIERINVDSLELSKIGEREPDLIIGGVGITGNQFIDNREHREWLSERFEAFVTDMESAAVAHVCAVNGLPFVIFRSASDLAGGSGSATAQTEIEQFFKVAARNSSLIVLAYLMHLD